MLFQPLKIDFQYLESYHLQAFMDFFSKKSFIMKYLRKIENDQKLSIRAKWYHNQCIRKVYMEALLLCLTSEILFLFLNNNLHHMFETEVKKPGAVHQSSLEEKHWKKHRVIFNFDFFVRTYILQIYLEEIKINLVLKLVFFFQVGQSWRRYC